MTITAHVPIFAKARVALRLLPAVLAASLAGCSSAAPTAAQGPGYGQGVSAAHQGLGATHAAMGSASDGDFSPTVRTSPQVMQRGAFRPRLAVDVPGLTALAAPQARVRGNAGSNTLPEFAGMGATILPHSVRSPSPSSGPISAGPFGPEMREKVASYRFPERVAAGAPAGLDPLGDAFVGNWEEQHVPPDRFVPLTGSLDLSMLPIGTFYGRAWGLDEDLRGLGFGMAWRLPENWDLAAEVGIDPFSTLEEGRVSILLGFSRRL